MENSKYVKSVSNNGKITIFKEEKQSYRDQICEFSQDPEFVVGESYCTDDSLDLPLEPRDYLLLLPQHGELAYSLFDQEFFEEEDVKPPYTSKAVLEVAFDWEKTDHGFDFWYKVYAGQSDNIEKQPSPLTPREEENESETPNQNIKIMTTKKVIFIAALTSFAVHILLNWWVLVLLVALVWGWIWCGKKGNKIHEAASYSSTSVLWGPASLCFSFFEARKEFLEEFGLNKFKFQSPIAKKEENNS